ncbi:PLP-dependent aminotransferase family protein [Bartonella sp. HY038]|uniref:aminotransferase-like domain-containing protein n=1 Tax=Bartonella sp. HY038 TaxID=2759660 RepID=UPI0015FD4E13|nr:PLP-dependent aminotransferase family protein [Bartonella sp. HY038]
MSVMANMVDKQKTAPITRVEFVTAEIRERIATRHLAAGERLPSIRGFAEKMGVSKSTVVEAYERLCNEGIIRAKKGAGFFVSGHNEPLDLAQMGPQLDRMIDPLWVSRQSLESGTEFLKPGCGWLPSHWLAEEILAKPLRQIARAKSTAMTDYGPAQGHIGLRTQIARRLTDYGIEASPDMILLTDCATGSLDLLCRLLLEPGDTVLVDDPCYFNFLATLRAHRVKTFGVPYLSDGPDETVFAQLVSDHSPKLYITNSAMHNPTGAILSPLKAHRILKIIENNHMMVIEDDVFADFEYEPAPRFSAFDGLKQVALTGSFSKTISASMRCGYIVAPKDWMSKLSDLRIATAMGGINFAGEVIYQILKDGSYRRHCDNLRGNLARLTSRLLPRFENMGFKIAIKPQAGIFIWAQLPNGLDSADLAQDALKQNIILAPGNVFSLSQTKSDFMRFNIAQSDDEKITHYLQNWLHKNGHKQ